MGIRRWSEETSYCTLRFQICLYDAGAYDYNRTHTSPRSGSLSARTISTLSNPLWDAVIDALRDVLFDNVLWTATSSQVSRWRKTPWIISTDMGHLGSHSTTSLRSFQYSPTHHLHHPSYPHLLIGRFSQAPGLGRRNSHHRIVSSCIRSSFTRSLTHHHVSQFLDNPELNWKAPRNLLDIIAKARSDGKSARLRRVR